jgi:hypothetical protein
MSLLVPMAPVAGTMLMYQRRVPLGSAQRNSVNVWRVPGLVNSSRGTVS